MKRLDAKNLGKVFGSYAVLLLVLLIRHRNRNPTVIQLAQAQPFLIMLAVCGVVITTNLFMLVPNGAGRLVRSLRHDHGNSQRTLVACISYIQPCSEGRALNISSSNALWQETPELSSWTEKIDLNWVAIERLFERLRSVGALNVKNQRYHPAVRAIHKSLRWKHL